MRPWLVLVLLASTSPPVGWGSARQEPVIFTLHVPKLFAGESATLYIDGEGFRLRIPPDATFSVPKARDRMGAVVLTFSLRDRPTSGMVREWNARPTLIGSRRVEWTLQPTGGEEVRQWPLLRAVTASGPPLEILVGGRLAGRTPLEHGIAPDTPQEVLWREPDGSTVCILDLPAIPADSVKGFECNPATRKVEEFRIEKGGGDR